MTTLRREKLRGTDLNVSSLCLGTGPLGVKQTENESHRLLDAFVEAGGNFIDTARVYSDWVPGEKGRSERIIGDWMRDRGNGREMVIGTKGLHPELDKMEQSRVDPESARYDIEASLKALGVERIDLYWLHRDDPSQSVGSIIGFMNEFVREGKIRYLGASNWTPKRIKAANAYAEERGLQGFVANQPLFNLAAWNMKPFKDRTMVALDQEGFDFHKETGLPLVPFSSQAGGFFSKATTAEDGPDEEDLRKGRYGTEGNLKLADAVREMAEAKGCNANGIVLGYLRSLPFQIIPNVGANRVDQLKDSVEAVSVRLSEEEVNELHRAAGVER